MTTFFVILFIVGIVGLVVLTALGLTAKNADELMERDHAKRERQALTRLPRLSL